MYRKSIHIAIPLLTALWFVTLCIITGFNGIPQGLIDWQGIIFGKGNLPLGNNIILYAVNASIIALTAYLLSRLNSIFPLMKEHSYVAMMFFLLLQMLSPALLLQAEPANAAALLLFACTFILFTCYQQGESPKQSYLIALLLATASIFYARIVYFLPLFLIGFYQMKSLSLRTLVAFVLGIATPYWIIWGMDLLPSAIAPTSDWLIKWHTPEVNAGLIPLALTIVTGMFTGINNLLNAYTEKIQTRALNGFFNLLSIYATLLIFIDISHYEDYLPILNMGVAIQTAYYFTSHHGKANTVLFYCITVLLFAIHVWTFWVN